MQSQIVNDIGRDKRDPPAYMRNAVATANHQMTQWLNAIANRKSQIVNPTAHYHLPSTNYPHAFMRFFLE